MNGRKVKELRRKHPELPHPQRKRGGVTGANVEAPGLKSRQKRIRRILRKRDDA